ncbi:MAG TPA: hypothetical protein VII92_08350 [Anaerolineae bacterium]
MDLAEYMAKASLSDDEVGKRVGKDRTRISRYRRKLEPIPGDVVRQLVEISSGEMTANELLGISEAAE